jgi:hypothetical protein
LGERPEVAESHQESMVVAKPREFYDFLKKNLNRVSFSRLRIVVHTHGSRFSLASLEINGESR